MSDGEATQEILRIEVLSGARAGASHQFDNPPLRVGRHPDVDIQLHPTEDVTVSKEHALLDRDVGGWFVRDLDSRNGTLVNGDRLRTDRYLEDGDVVELGPEGPRLRVQFAPTTAASGTRESAGEDRRIRPWLWAVAVLAAAAGAVLVYFALPGDIMDGGSDGTPPQRPGPAALEQETVRRVVVRETIHSDTNRRDTVANASDPVSPSRRALERRLDSLARALRESRQQVAALEERLAEKEGDTASEAEQERQKAAEKSRKQLERKLQSAQAALRRQQLAANIDVEAIEQANWRALAQVYVEWPDGRVVTASAFSIRPSGILVTAGHVVRGRDGSRPQRLAVQFARSRQVWLGEVLAASRNPDVALIRARGIAGSVPTVKGFNRRPDTLASAIPMVIMGFPLGGDVVAPDVDETAAPPRPLVSLGVLSGRSGRLLEIQGYGDRGASGSPIFDSNGRVVGILLGGREESGRRNLLGIPIAAALSLLEDPAATRSGDGGS